MESQDLSAPDMDASRPSLGFPLGTAFLLIAIFTISGICSCCYHWDKLRSLRRSYPPPLQYPSSPHKSRLSSADKQNRGQSFPVLMPGDEVPKFIAMPCPCEPHRISVTVQKPPLLTAPLP
ncbi:uncharacterized protein At5g65660-like [Prosopis cineraria]|uniref:uncharacterized protein At5g65660-like n=1 Tax=Prosopis cineraria TaxID=364024 RepID=UPI0024106F07|nr:uncharacterized protein At5g65660-like [Prosopis cineraria]